jgi:hypothetical protein
VMDVVVDIEGVVDLKSAPNHRCRTRSR